MNSLNDAKKLKSWMRRNFIPECTKGWDSTIHIILKDAAAMTVDVSRREMKIRAGLEGKPLAVVRTDCETLLSVLRGDEPLDLAVMKDTLSADNMIEVFKFVTVFKYVRRRGAAKKKG
jgi:hypothetical protein